MDMLGVVDWIQLDLTRDHVHMSMPPVP